MFMIQLLRGLAIFLLWLYTTCLALWWGIHLFTGDTIWWVALLGVFTPHLFAPLLFFWPIGIWVRRPAYRVGLLPPSLLFIALYGILFIPQSAPAYLPESPPFRIMTFNLWEGSYRARTPQVILANKRPDIVVLQEVTLPMQSLLLKAVGQHYPYFLFDTKPGQPKLGLLSRYPVERVPSELTIDLSCRQYRVTVAPTQRFRLYNCHPRSTNILYSFGNIPTVIQRTEETFRIRTVLSERLAQAIKAHAEPTVVVGDFNTTDQSDAYHNLRTVLNDAHRASGWGFGHTFPAWTGYSRGIPIIARQVRIDMVLYTNDFVALQAEVSSMHGESDHYPFLATLGWRRPEK